MCYIADVLVLVRFILAALLGMVSFVSIPGFSSQSMIGVGLLIFVVGELTDAFDGPAARRWHYPLDGKHRWWRERGMNVLLDKVADICLALMMMLFFCMRVSGVFGLAIVCIAVPYALFVEFRLRPHLRRTDPKFCDLIIMERRYMYVLALCVVGMITLWMTDWGVWAKVIATVTVVVMSPVMIVFKCDRLSEVDTPM